MQAEGGHLGPLKPVALVKPDGPLVHPVRQQGDPHEAARPGVVDGVLTANTGGGNTWKDLLKYNYRIGVNYFNSVVIANKDRFAKLPPDVQEKVKKIVKDNMPLITSAMENDEDNLTKKFAEGGMTVTEPSAADLDQAAKIVSSFWDDWAKSKGPDAASAVKQVRAALGR